MSQRRMFSPKIVESDEFIAMPVSSQALYFHLGMNADDDGFIQPTQLIRAQGFGFDDLKVLLSKRFILAFESGVIVIKHWLIHNLIQKDRYHPTRFQEELKTLQIKDNKSYTDSGNNLLTEVRLGKDRLLTANAEKITIEDDNPKRKRRKPDDNAMLIVRERERQAGLKFTNAVTQAAKVRAMLDSGYTKKQILDEYVWLEKQDYWKSRGVDFTIVASQIHKVHN